MLKRLMSLTNRRVRLLVGLMLIGLFCIQCAPSNAIRSVTTDAIAKPLVATASAEKLEAMAKTDHLALIRYCLEYCRGKYPCYTCTFIKQERLGGVVGPEQEIQVKFMEKPFSVAMNWKSNPPKGDRVLYVEGKYDDEMLVRPSNAFLRKLAPTVTRKVDDVEAMKSTLRPVNLFGFQRGLKSIADVYAEAGKCGDLKEEFGGYAKVKDRDCYKLVRYLTARKKDYPAYKTVIYIDTERLVPVMIEGFDWGNEDFLCRYIYTNVKFDANLADDDFRPECNDLKTPQ